MNRQEVMSSLMRDDTLACHIVMVERTGNQVWIVPDLSSSYARILESRIAQGLQRNNSFGCSVLRRIKSDLEIWYSLWVLKLIRRLGMWEL